MNRSGSILFAISTKVQQQMKKQTTFVVNGEKRVKFEDTFPHTVAMICTVPQV